jgi:hypothetical protein
VKRPRLESLKSKARLIIDARKRKNLTHLQSILLFKDSKRSPFVLPALTVKKGRMEGGKVADPSFHFGQRKWDRLGLGAMVTLAI